MTRSKAYKISRIVTVAALAVVLVWDLYAQIAHGLGATVSFAVWEFSREAPFVPFLVGFVMGHLFWGTPLPKETRDLLREWEEHQKNSESVGAKGESNGTNL